MRPDPARRRTSPIPGRTGPRAQPGGGRRPGPQPRVHRSPNVSQRFGLGPSLHLGAAVLTQRVDRAAGQVHVGVDPFDALAVAPATVVEHREQARETLGDQPVVDEEGWHLLTGTGWGHGRGEVVLADRKSTSLNS